MSISPFIRKEKAMKTKMINSQLNNFQAYLMYRKQLCSLAKNVFLYDNMPENIDVSFCKERVLKTGSIAFFRDDILGVLALPYNTIGSLDIYGRPLKIEVYSSANSYRKTLNNGEFIILYDNTERRSLMPDIIQYSERLALCERVIDTNLRSTKDTTILECTTGKRKNIT